MEFIKTLKRKIKNIDDMIILNADGGLGSVILVYALGLNIRKKTGKTIKFDTSWYEGEALTCDKKLSYELIIKKLFPDIEFNIATKKEIKFYKKNYKYKNERIWKYNSILFTNKKPKYFEGYYAHYKYWLEMEKDLQKNLDFSKWTLDEANKQMAEKIKNSENSVSVHVRRGDFLALGWCCLEKDYYINALKYVQSKLNSKINVFVFSNDLPWVKKEILPHLQDINYEIVDINNHYTGYMDLYLMSLCKHQIIANSTFSICSAILNKNKEKIIVAPSTWGYYNENQNPPPPRDIAGYGRVNTSS